MTFIVDGTNGLTFNNATTQASAGQVLQVVSATNSTYTQIASTSFTDTGLTVSITPKFSTSKILVIVNQQMSVYRETNASITGCLQIVRGSTSIYLSEKYNEMVDLLRTLYDDNVANNYERRYFTPSPSSTFSEYGWTPLINWCKDNGYDSIKFHDESFDTFVRDITYLIFDGNKPKIIGVYEVEDAVESNFISLFVNQL
jgi:hypothetical protein